MSNEHQTKRKGLSLSVILFFVFAILIIGAFLIVALVKSCSTDEEIKKEEQNIENNITLREIPAPEIQLSIS